MSEIERLLPDSVTSINTERPNSNGNGRVHTELYRRRWYILVVFSLCSFTQSLVWNTWGPIAAASEIAFGWKDRHIAMLALWGPVMFVLSVYLFSWLMQTKGLRLAVVIEMLLITGGCAIRCIPVRPELALWTMNAGQILDSLAGPVAMAGSTVVSAAWFPPDRRTTATAIVTRVQSLGGGLPFLLGPLVVDLSKYNISGNTTRYENNTSVVEGIRNDVSVLMYIRTFWINWATFGCAVLCIPVFAKYKSVYGRLDLDIPDSQKQPNVQQT